MRSRFGLGGGGNGTGNGSGDDNNSSWFGGALGLDAPEEPPAVHSEVEEGLLGSEFEAALQQLDRSVTKARGTLTALHHAASPLAPARSPQRLEF